MNWNRSASTDDGLLSAPWLFGPAADLDAPLIAAVRDVFAVTSHRRAPAARSLRPLAVAGSAGNALAIRGHFLIPSDEAYDRVAPRFRALGYTALFRQAGGEQVIYAVPGELPEGRSRAWLAVGLLVLTALSVLFAGAASESGTVEGLDLLSGLPYAVSVMAILLAHEGGHYFMARRLRVRTSFPFLIPLPISPIGTMGAVMQMKAPPRNRSALLAVGAAGPIAGLIVAVPILLFGLSLSPVLPNPPAYVQEGNSILYALLKFAMKGQWLPGAGVDVRLHPIAWAGWIGLLITSLNLIPAGQLDGGHMAYVLLGRRARLLTLPIVGVLIALGLTVWWQWYIWAGLLLVFGQIHAVPLDDVTPVSGRGKVVAALLMLVFVLLFMPAPLVEVSL